MNVKSINQLSAEDAKSEFMRCCHSTVWAEEMLKRLPFKDEVELIAASESISKLLTKADWLEAFAGHPKIGQDVESLRAKFQNTAEWSSGEQAGVNTASQELLEQLSEGNRAYERKFGYIFIVCAAGKSAAEMLALLKERLNNSPGKELLIAVAEQEKITRLRLAKLAASLS